MIPPPPPPPVLPGETRAGRRPAMPFGDDYWIALTCLNGHNRGTWRFRRRALNAPAGSDFALLCVPVRWARVRPRKAEWVALSPADFLARWCPCGARSLLSYGVPEPKRPPVPTRCAWAASGRPCQCADGPHPHGGGR